MKHFDALFLIQLRVTQLYKQVIHCIDNLAVTLE